MLIYALYSAVFAMLDDILNKKKCFKLVCAAGNEDVREVERLVFLYSSAGAVLFDVCAKPEIVDAAKNGIKKSGCEQNRFICVSLGIQGDPHVCKAEILPDKCSGCSECIKNCPNNAVIHKNGCFEIDKKRCIGCSNCIKTCSSNAISMKTTVQDFNKIIPPLIDKRIDCIELHASGSDEFETEEKWNIINHLYDGMLSICIDRSKLGNEQLIKRIRKLILNRKPYTTIIQADGAPMSGQDDDYKTTLQAVAAAEIFQNEKLPVYLMLSGGTNSKTTRLAKMCNIDAHGVAIGSYARKIVREFIIRDDFYTNKEVFDNALFQAKQLVDTSLSYMGEIYG